MDFFFSCAALVTCIQDTPHNVTELLRRKLIPFQITHQPAIAVDNCVLSFGILCTAL
jgi:hypothetical protein